MISPESSTSLQRPGSPAAADLSDTSICPNGFPSFPSLNALDVGTDWTTAAFPGTSSSSSLLSFATSTARVSAPSVAPKRKSKRDVSARRKGPSRRAPNCFFFFRAEVLRADEWKTFRLSAGLKQSNLSKLAGRLWSLMDADQKRPYVAMHKERARQLKELDSASDGCESSRQRAAREADEACDVAMQNVVDRYSETLKQRRSSECDASQPQASSFSALDANEHDHTMLSSEYDYSTLLPAYAADSQLDALPAAHALSWASDAMSSFDAHFGSLNDYSTSSLPATSASDISFASMVTLEEPLVIPGDNRTVDMPAAPAVDPSPLASRDLSSLGSAGGITPFGTTWFGGETASYAFDSLIDGFDVYPTLDLTAMDPSALDNSLSAYSGCNDDFFVGW